MAARDIDLDYADDGDTLQHALLDGAGVIALTGQAGVQGRTIRGDRLDLALAPDGALTSAIGRGGVSLDLPAAPGGAARSIRARSLDAAGEAGKGLTATRFTDDVEYREVSGRGAGSGRVARSRALTAALDGDEIGEAVFSGAARFEQDDLRGTAAEARYLPSAGSLRLSGTEAGALPLHRARIDLRTLTARAADLYREVAEEKNIAVTLEQPAPVEAAVDAVRLGQAINNLLDNALKYTPAGGGVVLALRQGSGHAILTVTDNGPGIPPAEREAVFRRLYREIGRAHV